MFKQDELDTLVYWINERDRIRASKERGDVKPWTQDTLLRDFKWCNVRRLDDRVSRWLFDPLNWYAFNSPNTEQVLLATLGRLINWPDSLAEIHDPLLKGAEQVKAILESRYLRGDKTFTGAYIVPGVKGMSKVASVVQTVNNTMKKVRAIVDAGSMKETWTELVELDGLGRFLAGQIVADLAHMSIGQQWTDRDMWAPCGPGSARGLNRLRGALKDQTVTQDEFTSELGALALMLKPRIVSVWTDRNLQAMDIQNCLCEFDKYRRLTLGEGKVRSKYPGAA